MTRNFSEDAKNKLCDYVDEVTADSTSEKVADFFGDGWSTIKRWTGFLNIKAFDDVDEYHKAIIDTKNTSKEKVIEIFENVKAIDSEYRIGLSSEYTVINNIDSLVQQLRDTIDPAGGNLDMSADRKGVLDAARTRVVESDTSSDQTAVERSLGTDPDAVELSIDPVNLATGNFIYDYEDIMIAGEIPLSFHRYYNSKDVRVTTVGKSFRHNYEYLLDVQSEDKVNITLSDGAVKHFVQEDGVYISTDIAGGELHKSETGFEFKSPEGILYKFNNNNKVYRMEDRNKKGISFVYDDNNLLMKAENDNGHSLVYEYDEKSNLLTKVTDHTGRSIKLVYEGTTLVAVENFVGRVTKYNYNGSLRIEEVSTSEAEFNVKNQYDKKFRVTKQDFPDGGSMSFEYNDNDHTVAQIERNGVKTVYVHDDKYRNTEIIYHDGTTEQYVYNDRNQCIKHKDRMNNVKRMAYDDRGNLTQIIDPLRRKMNMTYDADNNLLSLSINGKRKLKNTYDKNGNLLMSENYSGNGVKIVNDAAGRPMLKTFPDGSKQEVTYDSKGNISTMKNALGGIVLYFYDDLNRTTKVIDPNGNETCFEYDAVGNITKETNALGYSRAYTYNKSNLLVDVIDYNGTKTSRSYNAINKLEKYTNEKGVETRFSYDPMWNVSKVLFADGTFAKFEYNSDNLVSKEINAAGTAVEYLYNPNGKRIAEISGDARVEYEYDAASRLTKITNVGGNVFSYEYNAEDNLTKVIDPMGNEVHMEYDNDDNLIVEGHSAGAYRKYTYDAMGNVATVTDEGGRTTKYTYIPGGDKVNTITYPDGTTEKFVYNLNGDVIKHIDILGNATEYIYDKLDRITEVRFRDGSVTKFTYDEVNNVTSITDAENNVRQFVYSLSGELIKAIDATGNEAEYSYDANGLLSVINLKDKLGEKPDVVTKYERNALGNITAIIDALGNKEQFVYDGYGNVVEKIDKDGFSTKYGYNKFGDAEYIGFADGREVKMSYNALRMLEEVKDWTGTTKIINDEFGRARSVVYPDGKEMLYSYDISGNRTGVVYPDGKAVNYKYDNLNRLVEMKQGKDIISYEYDEYGRVVQKSFPNNTSTEYAYNTVGLIESIINKNSSGIVDEYIYNYDRIGNKTGITRNRADMPQDNGFYAYQYDPAGRLCQVSKDEKVLRTYTYDSFGNRVKMQENGIVTNYAYNQLNQLVSKTDGTNSEKYVYDRRGNINQIYANDVLKNQYVYGANNRMEKAVNANGATADYIYNGLGFRVGKNSRNGINTPENKIKYILDMTMLSNNLRQKEENGEVQSYFYDGRIAGFTNGSTSAYFMHDDLGSPIRLMGENGLVAESYGYDEFGMPLGNSQSHIQPFGYTGYQWDTVSGTYFAQAREYLPMAGRFAARDIVKGTVENRESQNEYTYCQNNPTYYVDPDGRIVITALITTIAIGAAIGAGVGMATNAIGQGIKMARGQQDEWKWGSFIGSGVSGAISGGFAAVPGVGWVGTIANAFSGGAIGGAAESFIEQKIDNGVVDTGKVLEDAVVGGTVSAVFAGLDEGWKAVKNHFNWKLPWDKKTVKVTTSDDVMKQADEVAEKQANYDIKDANYNRKNEKGRGAYKRAKEALEKAKTEYGKTLKDYSIDLFRKKILGKYTGWFLAIDLIHKHTKSLFNIPSVESFAKKLLKRWIPLSNAGDQDLYTLIGKFGLKCPLYA